MSNKTMKEKYAIDEHIGIAMRHASFIMVDDLILRQTYWSFLNNFDMINRRGYENWKEKFSYMMSTEMPHTKKRYEAWQSALDVLVDRYFRVLHQGGTRHE